MKLYIAGPMGGVPEFNFPLFHKVAAEFRAMGHEVFNPAENDKDQQGCEPDKLVPDGNVKKLEATGFFSRRKALAQDLYWIAMNAEGIVMLPGWENSGGAKAEYALAQTLGCKVWFYDTGLNDFQS